MSEHTDTPGPEVPRVVSAERIVAAPADRIFELIADPARQPDWDGNDNLAESGQGQRVHGIGDVFTTTLTTGAQRENRIVEFSEGRLIAWLPSVPGEEPRGHLWRWELTPLAQGTQVRHTYDWSDLSDPTRFARATATTSERLAASIERLAALVEEG